jgi:hypothetical protein
MSEENVEIVQAALSAIGDRDHRQAAVLFSPDAEWHNTSAFPGPLVYVGPDAIVTSACGDPRRSTAAVVKPPINDRLFTVRLPRADSEPERPWLYRRGQPVSVCTG